MESIRLALGCDTGLKAQALCTLRKCSALGHVPTQGFPRRSQTTQMVPEKSGLGHTPVVLANQRLRKEDHFTRSPRGNIPRDNMHQLPGQGQGQGQKQHTYQQARRVEVVGSEAPTWRQRQRK